MRGGGAVKERKRCGMGDSGRYGLTCYLDYDHEGDHQGYLEAHDRVLFWPVSANQRRPPDLWWNHETQQFKAVK